jgi:hypothetical protein
MPELIFSGFGTEDVIVDLTGKTADEAIKEAIDQVNEKGEK